ncbi:hypothetical protein FRC04_009856 [Tulasnella sp. 424]|nr:hypothetical protein FRC04_009856 [Tulasnella sp. 424]
MSLLSLAGSRKRKSSAMDADGKEETPRDPKRPRICMKSGGSADIARATILATPVVYLVEQVIQSVAVKKFRFGDDTNRRAQNAAFANELGLLSELHHENIVRLLGFVENAKEKIAWIVLPWETNGNLREFVQSQDWAIPERLSLIYDVACGIKYLHSRNPPICHADLKSLNILVNHDNHAIITDFGSARKTGSRTKRKNAAMPARLNLRAERTTSQAQGQSLFQLRESGTFITLTGPVYTLRWAAPEVLKDEAFGLASDIWAFGWICWEIMTGNIPFDDLRGEVAIILRVTRGDLPIVASNEHISQVRALCRMMTQCWEMDPTERPVAKECEWSMSSMLLLATAALGLGSTNTRLGEYADADEWYSRARKIFNQIEYRVGMANASLGLGDIYRLQGEYTKAEESYSESRLIYTQTNDQLGVANAELGLGDIHRLRDELPAAEALYLKSREIYTKNKDEGGVAHAVWALGEVYRLKDQYYKAEASYAEAMEIYNRGDDESGVANTVWGLGEIYRLRGELSKAEASYIKARDIYAQIKDENAAADAVWGLGEVYRLQGEYVKAEASYTEARELSTRVGYIWGVESAISSLLKLGDQWERHSGQVPALGSTPCLS